MPRWAIIFILVLISADQLLKQYMLSLVFEPPRVIEVTGFFNLVPVWNRGVSFGMLGDSETSRWILIGLALVILVVLVVWLVRSGSVVVCFALVLVIGGALSNVIDRVVFGAVVDFIDIHAFGWHWPAFNLADMSIVAGTALLLFDSLFSSPRALK